MAFVPSTIPQAKESILTLLAAANELDGVQQEWGHPGLDNIAYESIFFGADVEDITEEDRALGNRTRTETYTLTLHVCVYAPGNDAKACEVRCYSLAAVVEEVIRLNPRLSNDPIQDAVITGVQPRNFIFDQGRSTEIDVRIQVKARKTTN